MNLICGDTQREISDSLSHNQNPFILQPWEEISPNPMEPCLNVRLIIKMNMTVYMMTVHDQMCCVSNSSQQRMEDNKLGVSESVLFY